MNTPNEREGLIVSKTPLGFTLVCLKRRFGKPRSDYCQRDNMQKTNMDYGVSARKSQVLFMKPVKQRLPFVLAQSRPLIDLLLPKPNS